SIRRIRSPASHAVLTRADGGPKGAFARVSTSRYALSVFLDLFYGLRDAGVPPAIKEWRTFLNALEQGLHGSSLLRFYHLGRATLVKSETYFDAYDRVFARVFKGVEGALGDDVTEKVLEWLRDPKALPQLTAEQLAELERLGSDEL